MTAVLQITGLGVSYGKVAAVQEATLDIAAGEIACVIGANGAGKTSLLSATMGLLPSIGKVQLHGRDISSCSVEDRVRAGLCLVTEKRDLFTTMSVRENLELGAYTRKWNDTDQDIASVYSLFPRLLERKDQLAGTLSGGERQMLAIGRALMSKPRVLLLDEPSLGLAPRITKEILAHVCLLRQLGVAILLVEQNARAALAIADTAFVLELGQIVRRGAARSMADDATIMDSFLGSTGKQKIPNLRQTKNTDGPPE